MSEPTLDEIFSGPPKIGCYVVGCCKPWGQVHTRIATISACREHMDAAVRAIQERAVETTGFKVPTTYAIGESRFVRENGFQVEMGDTEET